MDGRSPITADDLDAVLAAVTTALRPGADREWSVPAGTLEWTCRFTAEHTGHCLLAYAAQLAVQPSTRYVRFVTRAEHEASPADVLEFVEAAGGILAAMVRASAPRARAFHPSGTSDPEGFAGMGCVEVLVHGQDIAAGLDLRVDPPRDVCRRVLARMFPDPAAELAEVDAWAALLWATGRADLPGRSPVERWRWHGAPLTG